MVKQFKQEEDEPAAAPGTVTVWGLKFGKCFCPSLTTPKQAGLVRKNLNNMLDLLLCGILPNSFNLAIVRAAGQRPLPLRPRTCLVFASKKRQKQSPPMPVLVGSVTWLNRIESAKDSLLKYWWWSIASEENRKMCYIESSRHCNSSISRVATLLQNADSR